jgi:hypothetical protein
MILSFAGYVAPIKVSSMLLTLSLIRSGGNFDVVCDVWIVL